MTEAPGLPAQDCFISETGHGTTWRHRAVIYQIYVRSFADHDNDNDGIGDLAGIRSRLGYLQALGVDGIWLTPCFPSPQHDHGYDVADYFDIEPDYGTLSEFDELMAAARGHRLRVMLDVVPNHCSWDHPWFQTAMRSAAGSPERERFYFRDGLGPGGDRPPNNWISSFGGPAWRRVSEPDGTPGQWYLHTFAPNNLIWIGAIPTLQSTLIKC